MFPALGDAAVSAAVGAGGAICAGGASEEDRVCSGHAAGGEMLDGMTPDFDREDCCWSKCCVVSAVKARRQWVDGRVDAKGSAGPAGSSR